MTMITIIILDIYINSKKEVVSYSYNVHFISLAFSFQDLSQSLGTSN